MKRTVKAYEDNAGGLSMIILENGKPTHAGTTWKPSASLRDDIIAALTDGNLYSWGQWYDTQGNGQGDRRPDGSLMTANDVYADCKRYSILIAEGEASISIYYDTMGIAGEKWAHWS